MAETIAEQAERERQDALAELKQHDDDTERRLKADEFVVVAAFINIKVRDQLGSYVVRGFNEGAVVKVENVDPANLRHLVDSRLLAPVGHPDAEFAGPAGTPKPGEPPNVPVEVGTPVEMLPTEERLARQRAAADAQQEAAKRPARKATADKPSS